MAKPRALVIRTAGTNCDQETKYAFELAGAETELTHVNWLAVSDAPFANCQILALPGGFTYGDDVGAGKVLAVELTHSLGGRLEQFIHGGGLVIGICNGFQALVKTGLLPGARIQGPAERQLTLTHNDSGKFEARWVRLRAPHDVKCVFAEPDEELDLPVAHGEGKLVARNREVLRKLVENGQVVYRYASPRGDAPIYPDDPNGSLDNIAGISDKSGRVFGLMPHPERHVSRFQHPRWTRERRNDQCEGEGLRLFRRAVAYFS
ncbi:MAG: phosphoribosylformylglycinamidine synthase I [Planctomycetota bacterium]|jgi:phosphoribosylformylglycinamidine synthase|nr:phosphoribosylformylglycinamidine synthase I [Planctomycetota bacterium]